MHPVQETFANYSLHKELKIFGYLALNTVGLLASLLLG